MTEYCVMKTWTCTVCDGEGSLSQPGLDVVKTFCVHCAGTGKEWEPVPLDEALKELGYAPLWQSL